MTKDSAIDVQGVSIAYDKKPAIIDVNLSVKSGEMFGLIGLNGAGKTTLIKALLALRSPDKGTLRLFGKPVEHPEAKNRLAFLPERFEPSWFLSGLEFLKFSASLYGRTLEDRACYEGAERLALDSSALKRRVQTYSKGMRQKLGLLSTIMAGCDLLILDEPMSGLDPVARALVKELLIETQKKGCTIFLSSHILVDMDEICDRVSVMHDHAIRFTGTPSALKDTVSAQNLEKAFLHFIERKDVA